MAAASWQQPCIFCGRRRYAGELLKESPEPPRTFLKLYLAEAGWWDAASGGGGGHGGIDSPCRRCPGVRLARLVACLPCLWFAFLPPIPPPALAERSSPVGKGETKVIFYARGFAPCIPGGWAGCGVRRGLAPGGTGKSIRVLQTRQKRLSRFCNTRHPSRHAGAQEKAGTGHERRIPSIIICSEKFWGVWGTLSRVPQRFPIASPRLPRAPPRSPALPRAPPRFNAEKQAQEAVFFRRL